MNDTIELDLFDQICSRLNKVKEVNNRIDHLSRELNPNISTNQHNQFTKEVDSLEKEFKENSRANDSKIMDNSIFVDANVFDENEVEAKYKKIIFKLVEYGYFRFILPHSVKKEINHEKTPKETKLKASEFIFTSEEHNSSQETIEREQELYRLLKHAKGNIETANIVKDFYHILEAIKYGAYYFITLDKVLLKKREKILELKPIKIIEPSELIKLLI